MTLMSKTKDDAFWKKYQGYQENLISPTCGNCKFLTEDKKLCLFGNFPVIETATCEMWESAKDGD